MKIAELRAQAARARVEAETLAAIAREAAAKAEAAAFNARVAEEAAADVMESKQTRRAA